jgi:hypothetical protein
MSPARLLVLFAGLSACVSFASAQNPSQEYIHLGGRVIAFENAPPAPTTPNGPASGTTAISYTYSTGGSGSGVTYTFSWGDGTSPTGGTPGSHTWAVGGTYSVTARAQLAGMISAVSGTWTVTITNTPPSEIVYPPTSVYPAPGTVHVGSSYSFTASGPLPRLAGERFNIHSTGVTARADRGQAAWIHTPGQLRAHIR